MEVLLSARGTFLEKPETSYLYSALLYQSVNKALSLSTQVPPSPLFPRPLLKVEEWLNGVIQEGVYAFVQRNTKCCVLEKLLSWVPLHRVQACRGMPLHVPQEIYPLPCCESECHLLLYFQCRETILPGGNQMVWTHRVYDWYPHRSTQHLPSHLLSV